MKDRKISGAVALWLVTGLSGWLVVLVLLTASGLLEARQEPPPREVRAPFAAPAGEVVSGENLGVRVWTGRTGSEGPLEGTLVAKVDGRWVEVRLRSGFVVQPVSGR
jgi:hypothetical protein